MPSLTDNQVEKLFYFQPNLWTKIDYFENIIEFEYLIQNNFIETKTVSEFHFARITERGLGVLKLYGGIQYGKYQSKCSGCDNQRTCSDFQTGG